MTVPRLLLNHVNRQLCLKTSAYLQDDHSLWRSLTCMWGYRRHPSKGNCPEIPHIPAGFTYPHSLSGGVNPLF